MVHQLFRASACLHARKIAVVGHGARLTYERLAREATRLAQELRRLGARDGDRVAVLMPNSAEAAVAIWAVLEAGCVLVPLHAAAREEALLPVLRDADPRWLIAGGELSARFRGILASQPSITGLIAWCATGDLVESHSDRVHHWSLAPDQDSATPTAVPTNYEAGQLAALVYTSGTAGEPKGAMLSHDNMVAALRAVNAYLHVESTDVVYSALPLSSSYGLYQLVMGLAVGATVVLDRSFAFPARSLALMADEKATVFAGVPTMYAWLATTDALEKFDLAKLRIMTSAAAALPLEHGRKVRERLPNARLFVMYGQTECKRISFLEPDDFERKAGSVGRGMPYQEHRVVDDSGAPVAPGEIGELVVRGPHVMQGYWRNAAATAHKLRPVADGDEPWLHTDDLFRIDEDGYLYFVGRRDDILKIGGHKVSPREIEEVLCQMPSIREAAVIGIPDPLWGEAAKAHVVLREGATSDAETVIRFCKGKLRPYMVPKAVDFTGDLPKTESGKVKKRDLS